MSALHDSLRRPGDHVLPLGKVQERWFCGKSEAGGFGHRVFCNLRFGRLQPPRWMMDFAAIDSFSRRRIQAIALGEEIRECAALRFKVVANGPISSLKRGARRARMNAFTFVLNPAIDLFAGHTRVEIRQVK